MRILHLLGAKNLPADPDRAPLSGIVRAALEIARIQAKRGHDVEVAVVGEDAWRATWQGVRLCCLKTVRRAHLKFGKYSLNFASHLPYVIKTHRERFDIVHSHGYGYLKFLRCRARVFHAHSDPNYPGASFTEKDFQTLSRYSDAQIAVSNYVAKQLIKGLADQGNVHTIYNGTPSMQKPVDFPDSRLKLRTQWGIAEQDVVILFVGAVNPAKGLIYLLQAFGELSKEVSNVHLLIAGGASLWGSRAHISAEPSEYEIVVQQIVKHINAKRLSVHMLGKVNSDKIVATYAAADFLVAPSVVQETFGLVLVEAMSLGLPVIASNVGGYPEVVDETCGLIVPPKDTRALLEAMKILTDNSGLRHQLRGHAEKRACMFSWETAVSSIGQIYLEALNK